MVLHSRNHFFLALHLIQDDKLPSVVVAPSLLYSGAIAQPFSCFYGLNTLSHTAVIL